MLFLGTETFPDENSYSVYLSEHGGQSNAYTASDATVYHWDAAPDALEGGLDRFAAFFTCPLFTESATARELNAVDAEHGASRGLPRRGPRMARSVSPAERAGCS